VEANVAEADFALDGGKLLLPVSTEAFIGTTGADSVERRGGVRADDVGSVDGEVLRGGGTG
jgi:hypothetical protein